MHPNELKTHACRALLEAREEQRDYEEKRREFRMGHHAPFLNFENVELVERKTNFGEEEREHPKWDDDGRIITINSAGCRALSTNHPSGGYISDIGNCLKEKTRRKG